jgi:uncharacterized delta-60 repeat protein
MPSYIELDKQSSFAASSNVGKVVLGISTNEDVTITNSDGVTTIVGAGGSLPYLEYASKISNVDLFSPKTNSVLNNTLGISPVWEKFGVNNYRLKLDKKIDVDKTITNTPRVDGSDCYSEIVNNLTQTNNFNDGFDNQVDAILIQSDGKIVIGGSFTSYNGSALKNIIRLNSDYSIDTVFASNVGSGFNGDVHAIVIQSDGKILVGGAFTVFNGNTANYIIRLNADGSVDNTFSTGGGFNNTVYSIVIQSDNNIIMGGRFESYQGNSSSYIARLTNDGGFDDKFIAGGGFNNHVYSITIQSDGKILAGGAFTTYNGISSNKLVRINTDGSFDNTFSTGGGFDDGVWSINVQSDGKILAGGEFTSYNGDNSYRIIRINTGGTIDNTFSTGGGFDGQVRSILIQSDGKILAGGGFGSYIGVSTPYIARLTNDGTFDSSFNFAGGGFSNTVYSIASQSDGKILAGGAFTTYNGINSNFIINLNSDGGLGFRIGFDNAVYSIASQSDGKIFVGGGFSNYNGNGSSRIIKLTNDGNIDSSFSIGGGFDDSVYSIAIQLDGKILAGGAFTSYNGDSSSRIIRINTGGTIDNTFSTGSGFDSEVYSIVSQTDNKIIIGGGFSNYNGDSSNKLVRLNTDGSIDNTFSIGSGIGSGGKATVYSIAIQSDGKILVGGDFDDYNSNISKRIIRLNTDGSVDSSFNIGYGFNGKVYSIAIQSDGKILVGGIFDVYNGTTSNNFIKLNTDGSFDNTFSTGIGFNVAVWSINIQSDGKILVGGEFTTYNGTTSNNFIKLNTDGSINTRFDTIFDSSIRSVAILSDDNILVGGSFTGSNNYSSYIRKFSNDFVCYLYKDNDVLDKQPIEIKVYN